MKTAPCTDCGKMLRVNVGGFWPFIADDNTELCEVTGTSGRKWGHRLYRDVADELRGEEK